MRRRWERDSEREGSDMVVIKGMREWGRKNKGSHIDRAREKQTQRAEVTYTHTHTSVFPVYICMCV